VYLSNTGLCIVEFANFGLVLYSYFMDTRDAGRMGAEATNKKLTHEQRSKAAKKAAAGCSAAEIAAV
jgi:hypothetical protein